MKDNTYVITRLCQDCVDGACVDSCPADCIVQHQPEGKESDLPNQLFIDPEGCVYCDVCVHECPWEAIFPQHEVPVQFFADIALNATVTERPEEFAVPNTSELPGAKQPKPTQAEVLENIEKWNKESQVV